MSKLLRCEVKHLFIDECMVRIRTAAGESRHFFTHPDTIQTYKDDSCGVGSSKWGIQVKPRPVFGGEKIRIELPAKPLDHPSRSMDVTDADLIDV